MTEHITLDENELKACLKFAESMYERHLKTSQKAVVDDENKKAARINRDYIAKAAECAVAKYLGVMPTFKVNQGPGGDYGFDLEFPLTDLIDTITIDVKHSTHPRAERLIWPLNKSMDRMADILAFVTTGYLNSDTFGQFTIHGWITSFQFKKLSRTIDRMESLSGGSLKPGTKFMPIWNLTPIKYLK